MQDLTGGIASLFHANGVKWLRGSGQLQPERQVRFTSHDGSVQMLDAQNIILATGSAPMDIHAAPLHGDRIVDSSGALNWTQTPQRLGIIGAGVIGLELGSVWSRLGAEVVLLEALDTFLPAADKQISRTAFGSFKQQGLDIRLNARLLSTEVKQKKVHVTYEDTRGAQQIKFDKLIVAVGRRPNTNHLASDEARLLLDEWGLVHVDEQCRTNLPGVYAIGDVTGRAALTPVAAAPALGWSRAAAARRTGRPGDGARRRPPGGYTRRRAR